MAIGLYAGSFDPPHLGHLSLIEVASRWCTKLYVVAAGNPNKSSSFLDLDERRDLLEASTVNLGNVVVLSHSGLVAEFAVSLDVDVLIRGMGKDQNIEFEMAIANEAMSGIPTVFLPSDHSTAGIASRIVRAEFLRAGPDAIRDMVPEPVHEALGRRFDLTAS